jgi:hypothetical protein
MQGRLFQWWSALVGGGALMLLSELAGGQATTITVDITKAKLTWTWEQGAGGPVEIWYVRCGTAPSVYSLLVEVKDPAARSLPVAQITPAPGSYFCVVAASNSYGTSTPSPEVSYQAGKAPIAATSMRIEAE